MPKTTNKLLSALAPWNAWDGPSSHTGISRDITPTLLPLIERPEALVLTGIRRGGKSTIMFQLVEALVAQGTDRTSILYVNFDEPAIEPSRGTALLEDIYQAFRERLCPRGRAIVFLDEVQHVPKWERWVNGRLFTENISIVVSGSSAQLMSREIATLLTGRNITVRIFPLSFSEYLRFRGMDIPAKNRLLLEKQLHALRHELYNFLQWGCFPEVTLERSDEIRARLLSQYLDDMLFKDVVMRHQIRDARLLRDMAVYLLTHTACRITLQSLRKAFGISLDMARAYLTYLEEPYLIGEVRSHARSLKAQQVAPRKVYAGDLGLRHVAALTHDEDIGRLEETAVFHALERRKQDLFYFAQKSGEVDFLVCRGLSVQEMIQVTHSDLSEENAKARELAPLTAADLFPGSLRTLITYDWPDAEIPQPTKNLRLWEWLLDSA